VKGRHFISGTAEGVSWPLIASGSLTAVMNDYAGDKKTPNHALHFIVLRINHF